METLLSNIHISKMKIAALCLDEGDEEKILTTVLDDKQYQNADFVQVHLCLLPPFSEVSQILADLQLHIIQRIDMQIASALC